MREATGYLTSDGKFFEDRYSATRHEATEALRSALSLQFPEVGFNRLIQVLEGVRPEILDYIDAIHMEEEREQPKITVEGNGDPASYNLQAEARLLGIERRRALNRDPADDGLGEGEAVPVQQFPPR